MYLINFKKILIKGRNDDRKRHTCRISGRSRDSERRKNKASRFENKNSASKYEIPQKLFMLLIFEIYFGK